MRKMFLAPVILVAAAAFAVTPQSWTLTSADDLLSGEVEGMIITADGQLKAGPPVQKVATFADPFVLSQTVDRNGVRYFGTGNAGKLYSLRGTELKAIATMPEPEIYSVVSVGDTLFAGTSPNGKVYKVDPASGKFTPFFDPKQAYIWAIAPLADGALAVATGVEGKLFRVSAKGEGSVWFDSAEPHLRSIAVAGPNRILVGGSGEGRIYEVNGKGEGRALFDSALTEISAIHYDAATKTAWAAAAAGTLPATPPAGKAASTTQTTTQTDKSQAAPKKDDQGSGSVEVTITYEEPSPQSGAAPAVSGAGEIYRIDADGFVEVLRRFDREIVYGITGGPEGSAYLSTGPQGRIYQLQGHDVALVATVPEKQVVSFSSDPSGAVYATTTNSGAVYRLGQGLDAKSEFRSPVRDAQRFSKFGHYTVRGRDLAASDVSVAFRSGNTETPDDTWSAWTTSKGAEGEVIAPAARYLQWKVDFAKPSAATSIDAMTVSYMNRNMAPLIASLSVMDPGAVIISANYPAAPQVLDATNPDEFGIFTSLDTPADRSIPGKKYYRKGFRTVTWKAQDPNGDALRYDLSFRQKGGSSWLRLRENMDEDQMNFDTSQLPDGLYELRLVASDGTTNPDRPLTDTKEGVEFTIDNTPPAISVSSEGDDIVVRVADAASPVGRVEYSVDAKKWVRLTPVDGIADSRAETFRVKRSEVANHFTVFRALDSFSNASSATIGEK